MLLLVNAVVLSWIVWCIVNFRNYAELQGVVLLKEVLIDMLENLIEVSVLVELSLLYSRIIFRVFWKHNKTIRNLFTQVIILTLFNILTCLVFGMVYRVLYPEDESIIFRIFISDYTVVSILSTTYFVSFLISRYRNEEEAKIHAERMALQNENIALQAKMDKLALQTNNHFMFNCFSTLGGMIRTRPEDAERFLIELSETYRYLVRNGDRHIIPLKDELLFTEHYVTLVHYRYDGISVKIDDGLRNTDAFTTPVSIQQLVENAVKHNRHGNEEQLLVEILRSEDYIVVRNNILKRLDEDAGNTQSGLKNLEERIRLISGKDIIVNNDGLTFTVRVPLIYEEELNDESMDY